MRVGPAACDPSECADAARNKRATLHTHAHFSQESGANRVTCAAIFFAVAVFVYGTESSVCRGTIDDRWRNQWCENSGGLCDTRVVLVGRSVGEVRNVTGSAVTADGSVWRETFSHARDALGKAIFPGELFRRPRNARKLRRFTPTSAPRTHKLRKMGPVSGLPRKIK